MDLTIALRASLPHGHYSELIVQWKTCFSSCPCRGFHCCFKNNSFWLAHAVLTSVACCSFLLRIPSWYSSPRWISSISSLSFSSTTWLSSFSAISTGCMQVPTSPVVKLLQNTYSSCVAFRDAYSLLTIPFTQQPSDSVRHRGLHRIACLCSSEKSLCFGLRKCSTGQRTLCHIYLFFWVFLECMDLFLPLG